MHPPPTMPRLNRDACNAIVAEKICPREMEQALGKTRIVRRARAPAQSTLTGGETAVFSGTGMPRYLFAFMLALLSAAVWAGPAPPGASKPNVVLIMTDDLGWADLGSYGAKDISTPNLDRLAREGVRFTDFYANGPLCTPTRAALMTGRYQQRYGLDLAIPERGNPGADRGLPADGKTLPKWLKDAGYATALVGKWHLGYRQEFSPNAHGFDYFFGLKGGFHDYYRHYDAYQRPDLWENDAPAEKEGYSTDLITAHAVSFIEKHAGRPFFIDVAYNAPHWPFQKPDAPEVAADRAHPQRADGTLAGSRADYVAMVERMDRGVGELLKTLDRLGLAHDTLVIFTNDNGGEWLSSSAPLFHRKWTLWEGGIRVPTILRWPGRVAPGQTSERPGITMDLTATILAAAGAPQATGLEGIDLIPALTGPAPADARQIFWRTHTRSRPQKAVREGDWKLVVDGHQAFLFNLRTDPGERNDLAYRHPDIMERLRRAHADWEQTVDREAADNGYLRP